MEGTLVQPRAVRSCEDQPSIIPFALESPTGVDIGVAASQDQRARPSHGSRLFEKVRVCPRPLEDDDAGFPFVDKEPVRFDVALTPADEFPFQCMVPESWIQRHFLNLRIPEQTDH